MKLANKTFWLEQSVNPMMDPRCVSVRSLVDATEKRSSTSHKRFIRYQVWLSRRCGYFADTQKSELEDHLFEFPD